MDLPLSVQEAVTKRSFENCLEAGLVDSNGTPTLGQPKWDIEKYVDPTDGLEELPLKPLNYKLS